VPKFVTPSVRFPTDIAPALVDYKASPLSERLANNVARAVDHHLEWTHVYYLEGDPSRLLGATELKDFRLHLFSTCRELQMMWDISDAAHHRILTRRSIPPRAW
jgi:hypothetical protein